MACGCLAAPAPHGAAPHRRHRRPAIDQRSSTKGFPAAAQTTSCRMGGVQAADDQPIPEGPVTLFRALVLCRWCSWLPPFVNVYGGLRGTPPKNSNACTCDSVQARWSMTVTVSNRQRELVTLLAQGQDTPAIAWQMFISRYTVQDHLKS